MRPYRALSPAGGRAVGVETTDGRRISARSAVVSSAHLATLPEMLGTGASEDLKEPSRTLTTMASMKTATYTASSGRVAHSCISATTFSVIRHWVSPK